MDTKTDIAIQKMSQELKLIRRCLEYYNENLANLLTIVTGQEIKPGENDET